MALRSNWVDALFARLTLRYGQRFLSQWGDIELSLVKSDWASVLAGFDNNPDAIKYGIDHLPDMPPNAMQFREICLRGPFVQAQPEYVALAGPREPMPDAIREVIKAAVKTERKTPAQTCVDNILAAVKDKGRFSEAQKHMLSHCKSMLAGDDPRRQDAIVMSCKEMRIA